uniref:Carboxypeptidase regulatory-like domain-containing protein n=1 Tax=Chryseobacterium endophyticum TaxID=1854762 RepID=A0AAU6WQU5_9FLAO
MKFMEQAFEWEIMSYYFYPYYWGNRNNWDKMYQFDDNDATFRAFMQSGMARVIVTVRPGFEEAVRHFMVTGQIWNGGEVPVIDDPMFLSIVDEMRKTEGEKYGKAWASRVPTALTILQAQLIGLNVTKALPFDDNLSDYEDPTKVPQSSQIVPTDAQMGGSDEQKTGSISGHIEGLQGLLPEIMLKNKDKSPVDFTNPDDKGDFWMENIPVGKYELCLDENDDFDNQYSVIEGKVTRVVEVKEASTTTVYLVVKKSNV